MKMNFKLKIAGFAVLFAVLTSLFAAFSPSKSSVRTFDQPDGPLTVVYGMDGREDQIYKPWTLDTLTTTEADTLNLGYQLASPYQYMYQFKVIKISGTPNLKIVLDGRNSMANSDWLGMDSLTISGADSVRTYFGLKGTNTYNLQHRLRLVGTTGVNEYTITGLLKKTN
jgi:hypothetical protein